ncbi:MAG: hypothetical protein GX550_08155 [Syntrophomonadaceae bacterium]|nr:hypothetical protein [Syntrophomonadaceae bacterium]
MQPLHRFFSSNMWNTLILFIIGVFAVFTGELVTFFMLGFVMIMLTNIYDKLDEISKKMDKESS